MPDLLKTAKQFATDVAQDAVNFPKTKTSWPAFKQALGELYTEVKNDLFFFEKTSRAPLLLDATAKIDALLQQPNTADKVDQLLGVRDEAQEKLRTLSKQQEEKTMGGLASLVVLASLGGLAFSAGGFVAGLAAGAAVMFKFISNGSSVNNSREVLTRKVNAEVLAVAGTDRAQFFASPKVQQALVDKGLLSKTFKAKSWSFDPQEGYAELAAKLPKPAVAAAPAPTAASGPTA